MKYLLTLLLLMAVNVHAHKASDSFLHLQADNGAMQLDLSLRDLEAAVGLDRNADDAISWGELRQATGAITAYALSRLDVQRGGQPCRPQLRQLQVMTHSDGNYAALMLDSGCAAARGPWQVHYRLLFDSDPLHRSIVSLQGDGVLMSGVISARAPQLRLDPEAAGPAPAVNFLREGVWHILIGYDHVLFLLCLLLPLTLLRAPGGSLLPPLAVWRAVLLVVTGFTVGHCLTLLPAASGWLVLPVRLVESLIALSVVLAALANFWGRLQAEPGRADEVPPRRRSAAWRLLVPAFAFGLVHGFGFAAVLSELPLQRGSLLLNIVLFNVGVELGQLLLVLLVLPALLWLRHRPLYVPLVVRGGSAMMAAFGLVWLLERSLDVQLWPQF